ncbi:MAG: serine protease [Desulfobacteraceae bacterium]|nr:serine protease [Desulfobacteraceae bacterium]
MKSKKWFKLSILLATMLISAVLSPATAAEDINVLKRSVVRISTVSQTPDYSVPWGPGNDESGQGSGFIISGQRILTNAHVVSNARFITIEKEGDSRRYEANVKFVAHDCDLAMLDVADESFFEGTKALDLDDVPSLDSTVTVIGYPIGGERLSITRGIVSRIDFLGYMHSGVDSHLVVQIDAAINPGNSGGPVVQNAKAVGVAFQGFSGMVAQNVGYMIPVPVIQRFLQDVKDGRYDFYVDLGIQFFPLINTTQRRALGLDRGDYGVMVSEVLRAGACYGKVQVGDVLLSIDGLSIFSDGRVAMDNDRLLLNEVVERKFKGDLVQMTILRNGKKMQVSIKLNTPWPYLMQAQQYDVRPRFVVLAGLVFQPLSNSFLASLPQQPLTLRYYYTMFLEKELYADHPEVIVISKILPDPVNTHLGRFLYTIIDEVNGVKIRTLKDLADAFAKPDEFFVIQLVGDTQPLVLEAKAVTQAQERILKRYGINQHAFLTGGIVPPNWQQSTP